jgi:hypothetical protein
MMRGCAVGCGPALKAGRSQVRLPMGSWGFLLIYSIRTHYGPVVDSASNRNKHQGVTWEVKQAGALDRQTYNLMCR